ncbi:MAG TPA: tetratricopeptide repeat protein, partial [Aestuariivirgaceae bacterium]|nr:tetratricopeptide repeat protein [Aestuariivirgaceae bacterium]
TAMELGEGSSGVYWQLVTVRERRGCLEEALATARQAIACLPDDAKFKALYGRLLVKSGDYEQAVKVLRSASQKSPELPAPREHLIDAIARQGAYDAALVESRQATEIFANSPRLAFLRGKLALQCGHLEEARDLLRRTVQLDPGHLAAHRLLVQALVKAGEFAEAVALVKHMRNTLPAGDDLTAMERLIEEHAPHTSALS